MIQTQFCKPSRRGSASAFVLVVLVVMVGLMLTRARHTIAMHRQTGNEQLRLQAEKLAEAGIQRAQLAWQSAPQPGKFEWEFPPGRLHQTNSGRVVIITNASGVCTVEVAYPSNRDLPYRVTRTQELSQ